MPSVIALLVLGLLTAAPAAASPWGVEVAPGWSADGLQLATSARYQWNAHQFSAGLLAYPPSLRDDLPTGGLLSYRYRFEFGRLTPTLGPEYQLTRHRGGTLHVLFWVYGIALRLPYGFAAEQSLGMGVDYLNGASRAAHEPDALVRFSLSWRPSW